jgi:hypothetical protein
LDLGLKGISIVREHSGTRYQMLSIIQKIPTFGPDMISNLPLSGKE